MAADRRSLSGARAHLAGLAAEDAVAGHYLRSGRSLLARRWRGGGGELDLVAREGRCTVFVEVKRAASFAAAAERIGARQTGRIRSAALAFLSDHPDGQNAEMRFDVALVDGRGAIRVIENALAA